MVQKYKSVSVPSGLVEDVEKVVGSCGYVSVTDFVKDAIRRRLEYMCRLQNAPSEVKDFAEYMGLH